MRNATLAAAIAMALPLPAAIAQEAPASTTSLGEIIVTAQRRSENIQDVPLSVSALEGERLSAMFEGGGDIQVLAARVPSLYAESSNGRLAPRFYIRGLGNSDFDLAASQPVSIIVDEVVLENVILKSFPMFDLERVEVLRGPQGTLFGRNTPAGIVKFDTRKPTQEFGGDAAVSYGELGSMSFEGAVGGGLTDAISFRLSALYQERDDWIDNTFTGENDAMGGYDEFAYRAQLLIEPSDSFSALLNIHGRDIDGTASIFRANVLGPGSDGFNSNYDRDSVSYDEGDNNPQSAKGTGGSLRLDFGLGERRDADVDHRVRDDRKQQPRRHRRRLRRRLPARRPGPARRAAALGDPCIPFPSADPGRHRRPRPADAGIPPLLAGERPPVLAGGRLLLRLRVLRSRPTRSSWRPTTLTHENTAWAVFGHVSYDVTDALTVTGGARYTDDEKDLTVPGRRPSPIAAAERPDDQVSWDLSRAVRGQRPVQRLRPPGVRLPRADHPGPRRRLLRRAVDRGLGDHHVDRGRLQVAARGRPGPAERRRVLLRGRGPAAVRHRRRRQLRAAGECRQGHRAWASTSTASSSSPTAS